MTIAPERERAERAPLSAPERKARRKRVLQWLLPVIGIALIAAVFLVTQRLMDDGLGTPRDATPEEVSASNTTQFTDAGIGYAERHQRVTLNLSRLPLDASALGMEPDAEVAIEPGYGFLDTTLYRGQGGGLEGRGYYREMMLDVVATTSGGTLQQVTATRSPVGWADFNALVAAVRTASDAFGWGVEEPFLREMTTRVGEAVRSGQPSSTPLGTGDAMGLPVSGSVECSGDGQCVLAYVFEMR